MLERPFCISAPFILNSKLLPAMVEVAVIVTTSPVQKVLLSVLLVVCKFGAPLPGPIFMVIRSEKLEHPPALNTST